MARRLQDSSSSSSSSDAVTSATEEAGYALRALRTLFEANRATAAGGKGGGVHAATLEARALYFEGCVWRANTAELGAGGGLHAGGGVTFELRDSAGWGCATRPASRVSGVLCAGARRLCVC